MDFITTHIAQSYIYLLQEREFVRLNENVFKIGMTNQAGYGRFNNYTKGSILLFHIICDDCRIVERELISQFRLLYKQRKDIGNEYFEGDYKSMIDVMYSYVKRDGLPNIMPVINPASVPAVSPESSNFTTPVITTDIMPASNPVIDPVINTAIDQPISQESNALAIQYPVQNSAGPDPVIQVVAPASDNLSNIDVPGPSVCSRIDKFEKEVRYVCNLHAWLVKKTDTTNVDEWELTTDYNSIIHKYHLQFPISFLQEYKLSQGKKLYYDRYEFVPTFNPPEYRDIKVYRSFRGWDILNKRILLNDTHTTKIVNDFENHKFTIRQEGKGMVFINYIKHLIGNDKAVWLMLQWIANLIIEPDNRSRKIPIIKGKDGHGKTCIYELMCNLIDGDSYTSKNNYCERIDNPAVLYDVCNNTIWEKIVINLCEPSLESLKRYKSKILDYTNKESIVVHGLFKKNITVKNVLWQIITTKHDALLELATTCPQYFIIVCNESFTGYTEHFSKFHSALTDKEALMDFYSFLKQIRNPEFGPLQYVDYITNNPILHIRQSISCPAISPFWGLMGQYITDCETEQIPDIMKKPVDIHKDLNQYCRQRGLSNPEDTNSIKIKLLDIDPKCFKRPRVYVEGREVRDEKYILAIDKVSQYMDAKHLTDPTISLD